MRVKISLCCVLAPFLLAPWSAAQQACSAGKALIIGNSAYRNTAPNPSSTADAHAVAAALRALHMEVSEEADAAIEQMTAALQAFRGRLHPGDLALVYYSGYVVQSQETNYLLPVDFHPNDEDLDSQAPTISRVQAVLASSGAGLKLIVIDAWRNPQLAARYPATELAALAPSPQTVVAYPVPSNPLPGILAHVRDVRHRSLFSRHLIQALGTPGLSPMQVLNRVVAGVTRDTNSKQVPILNSMIGTECYLTGPPPESEEAKLREKLAAAERQKAEDRKKIEESNLALEEQRRKASQLQPGTIRANPKDKQEYVWIPPGSFEMGCVPQDTQCDEDEKPRHAVTIGKGFWLGKTEVEVAAYQAYTRLDKEKPKAVMPKDPQSNRHWANTNLPIVNVSADDAVKFCRFAGGRLPTEAEWEYAARAGADGLIYTWGNALTAKSASYAGAKGGAWDPDSPAPVKQFDANKWGLYDMAGNVWEWCSDWYDPGYYGQSGKSDPSGPQSGDKHVKRGGSFHSEEKELRTSARHPHHTYKWPSRDNQTGFRCVVEQLP
jgi:formylglycine-generating enzyme required for sulfatase activity